MRERMAQHAEEMAAKMAAERDLVRKETKIERDEANEKVLEGFLLVSVVIKHVKCRTGEFLCFAFL